MIRDITVGQYYAVDSVIHRLDPRFKIIATIAYIFGLFMVNSLYAYIPVLILLALILVLSKVPFSFLTKGLRPIFFIILFTVSVNLFFTPGRTLFAYGFLNITHEGLTRAVFLGLRLILLIMGSSLMTLTTSPIALTDGLEALLNPLKRIGVPAHEIAMMMSIALRFIPTLLEETDKIMKAQMARGTDFETGSLLTKARNLVPILVPLFISAFRRADELALAMEARCYNGGEGRTKMYVLKYQQIDFLAMLVMALYIVSILAVNHYAL